MKTSITTPSLAGPSLGLLFAAFLASNAVAGPGPEYWRSLGQPKAATVEPAKPVAVEIPVCPGSEVVPVTAMKSPQSNGRPPLVAVQTGTQRVCHLCTTTSVVITNDWPSHRGPTVQKTEVAKVGATHVCTEACPTSSKA
ncbi:MAG: hypothetical protein HZA93_08375 [Verrucomicrobia bacterium]|nr:hypothetical protein [Verrucomicrobiota bacterium]